METGHYIAKISKNITTEISVNIIINIDNKPLPIILLFNQAEVILSTLINKYREGYAFQGYRYIIYKMWLSCLNSEEAEIAINIKYTIFITD